VADASAAAVACSALGGLPPGRPRVDAGDPLRAGILAVLAGRPAAAVASFRAAGEDGEPATAARAAAWGAHAASLRTNLFPGDLVASGTELRVRAGELWSHPAPPGRVPEPVEDEVRFVGSLLAEVRFWRSRFGPLLPTDDLDGLLAHAEETLVDVERRAQDRDDAAVVAHLRSVRAELLHRAGRADGAEEVFADAIAAAGGDASVVAAVHLRRCDLALAPGTSLEALDHVLLDVGLETSTLDWHLEGAEASPDAADPEAAARHLDQAAAVLGTPDGTAAAALLLRRAVLARTRAQHDAALDLTITAARGAAASGEEWLHRTAQVHEVLARVATGGATSTATAPAEVGSWGAGDGSFSHALGLTLLCSRVGRQWLLRSGDADRAIACFRLAGRAATHLGAPLLVSRARADEAAAMAALGARTAAVHGFQRVVAEQRERFDDPVRGTESWRCATSSALRVHQLRLGGDDPTAVRSSAQALHELAVAHPEADDPATDGALRSFAVALADGAETHAVLAEGDAARDDGDQQLADERYAVALAAATAAGDHLALAVVLARLGRREEAAATYNEHERLTEAEVAARIEELREHLGDDIEALLPQLDQTGNAIRRAAAFHTRLGAAAEAGAVFDRLEDHEPGWVDAEERPWDLLSDHGHVREQLGEVDRARGLHGRAVDALTRRSLRLARDEDKVALNHASVRVFGRAARAELRAAPTGSPLGEEAANAFALAEQGRARALADLLARGGRRAPSGGDADPVTRWEAASARVELFHQLLAGEAGGLSSDPGRTAELQQRLAAAEAELAVRADELRTVAPGLADAVTPPAPVTVEEVARLLSPGTVLCSHLLVDDDLLTFAVTPDGLAVASVTPTGPRDVERTLRSFTRGCATGGPWVEAGREAASLLLGPLRGVLDGAERLYLVPAGLGHGTPWAALPFADGLLADHVSVALLPSVVALRHLPPPTTPPVAPTLVVGDPEDPVWTAPTGEVAPAAPLPGARLEARAVAEHLPGATLLVGRAATAAAVRAELSSARTVHLAAHAVLDPDAPLTTAILLAHGEVLRVVDLVGARIAADLVVLSACDSGGGQVTGGDEVLGLTRALLAAGASAAVVSLWPIDDRATAVLVERFVAELAAGVPPPDALRRAQSWFRGLDPDGRSRAFAALLDRDDGAQDGEAAAAGEPATLRSIVRRTAPIPVPAHPSLWAGLVYVGAHPVG
jgi:CHAT domain-containing protein/tetratricopeptide (TPR) repeat protein